MEEVILPLFVHLTSDEPRSHVRIRTITFVAHDPPAANKNMFGISKHLGLVFQLPHMLIEIVELINNGVCNKVGLEYFSGVLINVLRLEVTRILGDRDARAIDPLHNGFPQLSIRGSL